MAEVVEFGLSSASVNRIAKRANVSVGSVYRYHSTMPELLASVYLKIKTEMHDVMLGGLDSGSNVKDRIQVMWFAMLDHALTHHQDYLFTEIMSSSPNLPAAVRQAVDQMNKDLTNILQQGMDLGELRMASISATATLLTAPPLQLARRTALGSEPPSPAERKELYDMCWRAVAKMK